MKKNRIFCVICLIAVLTFVLCGCIDFGNTAGREDNVLASDKLQEESSGNQNNGLQIQFIDVGQADAALIWCEGEYMLVDGGNAPDSNLIYSVLERNGVDHLKFVIGTHAHEDHIGGLAGAFEYATVETVLCPVTQYDSKAFRNFKDGADANGGIVVPSVGDIFTLGQAEFTILAVNSDPDDTNNTSIVIKLVYGDTSFLFTGDAEREVEQALLDSGYDLHVDVLKAGHHGSSTSTTYPFLRAVEPTYAIISCETGNSYGHPHEETLSKFRDAGVQLFRTDLQGDIFCTSDGANISFTTVKSATIEEINPTYKDATANTPQILDYNGQFIGNKKSKKVHIDTCESLPSENNRVNFKTLEDAVEAGYTECGRCIPNAACA